jgi:phospholipase/carboxylesterase
MDLKCLWKKDAIQTQIEQELQALDLSEKVRREVNAGDDFAPDPLIILLHGYGSNEFDLPGVAEALNLHLNWVSLRAPRSLGGVGGAFAWFDAPVKRNISELMSQADVNAELIEQWINAQKTAGVILPAQKFIFFGFSQGAVQAVNLLTRPNLQPHIHAVVALSGYLPFPGDFTAEGTNNIRVFHGYGLADEIVNTNRSDEVSAWLSANTTAVNSSYSELPHGICDQEITDIRKFLS